MWGVQETVSRTAMVARTSASMAARRSQCDCRVRANSCLCWELTRARSRVSDEWTAANARRDADRCLRCLPTALSTRACTPASDHKTVRALNYCSATSRRHACIRNRHVRQRSSWRVGLRGAEGVTRGHAHSFRLLQTSTI